MSGLNKGVNKLSYFSSPLSHLLSADNNIGPNGENLTITFLSLNRVTMSKRLLKSVENYIPRFKGDLLIVDNGSSPEQLEELKSECTNLRFNIKIVELGCNYGVAGARNRALDHINTDWVMCLDNDIYFISDPLDPLRETLQTLGCHFLNLPLLKSNEKRIDALGGHLYITPYDNHVALGAGTCFKQTKIENINKKYLTKPFLSNFLFGGASIFRKSTFQRLGGYDEQMFIGFEDLDFSIRLFREGLRIGNICSFHLVHDHTIEKNNTTDLDYEKQRYSSKVIEASALYLEKKYGYKILTPTVIQWVKEKNNSIDKGKEWLVLNEKQQKIKIALIADVDYWAFGNIMRQIEKNLNSFFDFRLFSMKELDWNYSKLFSEIEDFDIIHIFWRDMIPTLLSAEGAEKFLEEKVLSTCVYDHLFLKKREIRKRKNLFHSAYYYVSSRSLWNIYNNIKEYPKPLMVIEDGVDPDIFYPIGLERFNTQKKTLKIGWVGNSKWGPKKKDFKGFRTIVKPAVAQFEDLGYRITGQYCDSNERIVPHHEMVHYYSNIDILVCMSEIEGTPNPILEAMACGVPVISTNVGIVPQVLGPKQKEFILKDRSIEALQQAILKIYKQPALLKELSEENLIQIQNWTWKNQCDKFKQYFDFLATKI
ncbi:glycosyltransferase [Bacillus sp. JJ1532]|uniref:glycosyltransferase n=1 Tax=unclassified Bacillus (in: firmicutes) TaxID=185979 RepID=UPI0030003722